MNVLLLVTEEDKQMLAEKKEKGKEAGGIKQVARRFESEKIKVCLIFLMPCVVELL